MLRVYVLFVLEVGTRRVHMWHGIRGGDQPARNLMLVFGERAHDFRFLVRDRDTKFAASFDAVFGDVGIALLRSPPRAPKADA
jgi:putative transposase